MTQLLALLIFCQALGASVGAATAVWGEIAYVRAMRDGAIDRAERAHLDIIARGLRFGMSLILLSSFGLVVLAYTQAFTPQPATTASYWVLMLYAFLVVVYTWALSRKKVSFELGSALIFSAWWFLAYVVYGLLPVASFGSAVALFCIATALFYLLLRYARYLAVSKG